MIRDIEKVKGKPEKILISAWLQGYAETNCMIS